KQFGPMSGWVFTVNGDRINKGAGAYTLEAGDLVTWHYTNVDTAHKKPENGDKPQEQQETTTGNERLRPGPASDLDNRTGDRVLARFQDGQAMSGYAKNYTAKAIDLGFVNRKPTSNGGHKIDPHGTT